MNNDRVDLYGSWDAFWKAVTSSAGEGLTTAAAWIGMVVILGALVVYLWRRTRGYTDENGPRGWIVWAILFGAILAAPSLFIPAILRLIDVVANTGIGLWEASQN